MVKENGGAFHKRKVAVIQGNFSISVQHNLNLIKCWGMSAETQLATVDCYSLSQSDETKAMIESLRDEVNEMNTNLYI